MWLIVLILIMADMINSSLTSHVQGSSQATLLRVTGRFLFNRYLAFGNEVASVLTDNAKAYGLNGPNAITTFINEYDFDFPVASVKASFFTNSVAVEYEDHSPLVREVLTFQDDHIVNIDTQVNDAEFRDKGIFRRRILTCGGMESNSMVRALQSVRILKLATEYLYYDVFRDTSKQAIYLTEESIAFGQRGKEAIVAAQEAGIAAGTHYSLPYPMQVNVDSSSVSVDFVAHFYKKRSEGVEGERVLCKQRGTDIMYLDVMQSKVLRIDTLRHTLNQPDWVKQHFRNF